MSELFLETKTHSYKAIGNHKVHKIGVFEDYTVWQSMDWSKSIYFVKKNGDVKAQIYIYGDNNNHLKMEVDEVVLNGNA